MLSSGSSCLSCRRKHCRRAILSGRLSVHLRPVGHTVALLSQQRSVPVSSIRGGKKRPSWGPSIHAHWLG